MTANLDSRHLDTLHASGISDAVIVARGYRSITDPAELRALYFAAGQCHVPGLLLPMWTVDGGNGLYIFRPDNPRVIVDNTKRNPDGTHPQKVIKYEFPKGAAMRLDCPPPCQPKLADPSVPLWITEGQKKADALASLGLCAVALLGVWNWRGKNELGGATVLADWESVALKGRDVRLVFDSDVQSNPHIKQALDRLAGLLRNRGASVTAVYLPGGASGKKVGVDDWLAAGHTLDDLNALVQLPQPEPQAAPPSIELLDAAPLTLARPLALIDGRAYAATWLHVRKTITEFLDPKSGRVIKLRVPQVETTQELFVIRDDGATFGAGGDKPLAELGLIVKLSEIPPSDRLWTTAGVKAYRAGTRPQPADVFRRMTDVVNKFLDFDRSLAEQDTMAEFCACYALATWALDAFQVIGFLWSNGERGSGKTHLLLTVAQLSYLGSVILSGGSYASLRDLADYGAALFFDDAEELSDPRKSDPEKRSLLLAGNRRGAFVTIKEPAPDGRAWTTRYVNAFCPRAFSAIRLPDPVLASRTIIVPLIRTADRKKANADPFDFASWPHDRRQLVNDLWALALAHLAELPRYDVLIAESAKLTGRNLQPWRAILAVAAWLDDNGVPGLRERMEALSMAYQKERPELESDDITVAVIRALLDLCQCANPANCANHRGDPCYEITSAQVAEKTVDAIKGDGELWFDPDDKKEYRKFSMRVGHILRKMRLLKPPRPGGKGQRIWHVKAGDLARWAGVYGLPLPDKLNSDNVTLSPEIGTSGNIGTLAQEELAF